MFQDTFTTEEWRTLQFAPLWMFTVVAGIDRDIDAREMTGLAKELSEAVLYKEPLVKEVLLSVAGDMATVFPAYQADSRDVLRGLSNAADLLERKATSEQAEGFKRAMLLLGKNIAEASGRSFFRREKISKEEQAALLGATAALRVAL